MKKIVLSNANMANRILHISDTKHALVAMHFKLSDVAIDNARIYIQYVVRQFTSASEMVMASASQSVTCLSENDVGLPAKTEVHGFYLSVDRYLRHESIYFYFDSSRDGRTNERTQLQRALLLSI